MVIDIYISSVIGDDSNPGTAAEPLATLGAAEALIPDPIGDNRYRLHLRNEVYPLPTNDQSCWLRSRTLKGGVVEVFADEAWDSTVFTIDVSGAAAAGTGAAVVVTSGLTVNAQRGKSIRMTSGAAAGQYRRINGNTATDIKVNLAFNPAPADGDTFEIFSLNTVVNAPAASAPDGRYLIADAQLGGGSPSASFAAGNSLLTSDEGLIFRGLRITTTATHAEVVDCQMFLLGVDTPNQLRVIGGQVWSGVSNDALLLGWGLRATVSSGISLYKSAQFSGYFHGDAAFLSLAANTEAFVFGGFASRIFLTIQGFCVINAPLATPFLVHPGSGSVAIQLQSPSSQLWLSGADVQGQGAGIILESGAVLLLLAGVTGGSANGLAMDVHGASRCICHVAPEFGSPTNDDWQVRGQLAFNKSDLAAIGAAVLGSDGSVATRSL